MSPWGLLRLFVCPSRALPDRLQLLVAVVRFRTFYKRYVSRSPPLLVASSSYSPFPPSLRLPLPFSQRQGLCSTYLSTLPPGSTVPLWIRPGSFVLPSDPSVPCEARDYTCHEPRRLRQPH